MHSTERQRLVSTMSHEPAHALGVILKCGVCLALLILLAVIGSTNERDDIAQVRSGPPLSASVAKMSSAAAHRKEVFDGRRAHFLGNASERDFAGQSLVSHADVVAP